MGSFRRLKKNFSTPLKRWDGIRIADEAKIQNEFGLKSKREIWKAKDEVKKFRDSARLLFASSGPDAEKRKAELLVKVHRIGLLPEGASLDDVLGLSVDNILERRLQTQVYKKGLAKTANQARQLVVHRHILVDDQRITIPSYILPRGSEEKLSFSPQSKISDKSHPVRIAMTAAPVTKKGGETISAIDKEAERIKAEAKAKEEEETAKKAEPKAAVVVDEEVDEVIAADEEEELVKD